MRRYKRVAALTVCVVAAALIVGFLLSPMPLEQRLGMAGVNAEDFDFVTIYRHRERVFVWSSDDPNVINSLLDAHRRGISVVRPRLAVGEYLSFHFRYKHPAKDNQAFEIGMIGPAHYITEDGQFLSLFGGHTNEMWEQLLKQCDLETW